MCPGIGDTLRSPVVGRSEPREFIFIIIQPHSKAEIGLFQVADARHAFRLGFGFSQRLEKQPRQDRYDGNHHKQFDQVKATLPLPGSGLMVGTSWMHSSTARMGRHPPNP